MITQKPFGVWMDTHHAIIVGKENIGTGELKVIAHVDGAELTPEAVERNSYRGKRNIPNKYFNAIASHLQNATYLHATGTGQVQEQFIHYLADMPQFKNIQAEESTANKMSDEKLVEFFSEKFN